MSSAPAPEGGGSDVGLCDRVPTQNTFRNVPEENEKRRRTLYNNPSTYSKYYHFIIIIDLFYIFVCLSVFHSW
jgi:hypothetical protein